MSVEKEEPQGFKRWATNNFELFDRSFEVPEKIAVFPQNTLLVAQASDGIVYINKYSVNLYFLETVMPIKKIEIYAWDVSEKADSGGLEIVELAAWLTIKFQIKTTSEGGKKRTKTFTYDKQMRESERENISDHWYFKDNKIDLPALEFGVISVSKDEDRFSVILGS